MLSAATGMFRMVPWSIKMTDSFTQCSVNAVPSHKQYLVIHNVHNYIIHTKFHWI